MSLPPGPRATASDDLRLLHAIAAHDAQALTILYDRYAPVCYSIISRVVDDEPGALDILQRIFTGLWTQTLRYDGRHSVGGWLVNVARTEALDWLRTTQATRPSGEPPRTSAASDTYPRP